MEVALGGRLVSYELNEETGVLILVFVEVALGENSNLRAAQKNKNVLILVFVEVALGAYLKRYGLSKVSAS